MCSLDLTTEPASWKSAVQTAVVEIRRLGLFGLTENELVRYKQAIISEAEHSEAQADQTSNEDVLAELMEAQACGHVYMHPTQRLQATAEALDSITLEDVNMVTRGNNNHSSIFLSSHSTSFHAYFTSTFSSCITPTLYSPSHALNCSS